MPSLLPIQLCSIFFKQACKKRAEFVVNIGRNRIFLHREALDKILDWCLGHSNPSKYTFVIAAGYFSFETQELFSSFLLSPRMKHVSELYLGYDSMFCQATGNRHSLAPFRESETLSNLQSLSFGDINFTEQDAECLALSPHLTNLTQLAFYDLSRLEGMSGEHRTIDTLICSPIMNNLKSFGMGTFPASGLCVSQRKYLKNLTHLAIDVMENTQEWSLEPLLRCESALPLLTSLKIKIWHLHPEAAIDLIASPSSALFNRIESLNLFGTRISLSSMQTLCATDGLKSLTRLNLGLTRLKHECVVLLASAFSSSLFNNLRYLNVGQNDDITNASVRVLYESKNLPSLQDISFKHCSVTPNILKELCVLPARPNLRRMTFFFRITDESTRRAQEELKTVAPQLEIAFL